MKTKKGNYKQVYYKELLKYGEEHNVDKKLCSYLIDNYLNIPNINKINNDIVSKEEEKKFIKAIKRLKNEPIQYIVGNVNFYGYTYKVTKDTLIPRFETEELVENTIKYIKDKFNNPINLLDIGTGTGCIGITIKRKLPSINVTITDISKKALKIAEYNSKDIDIEIIQGNLLKPVLNRKFDVIISNPPYISPNEEIDNIVKKEPKKALYAKNNGLFYYEEILKNISKVLNKEFIIAFEIGETQKESIIEIINKYLKNVKIVTKKDLHEKDRMIFIFSD
jgi:release factor glutamine methyltransferase